MTGNTTPTTFITRAAGLIGGLLLLGLPLVGAQAHATDSIRTVDVTLSRYAFSPERIEVRLGERVHLNVVSVDTAHGFQVKELGLNVPTDTRGKTVTVDLIARQAGTFLINCSEYCGHGHSRKKAWLIVTPKA